MKKVYICCKFGKMNNANVLANMYCRLVYDAGYFPIFVHSYLKKFLDYDIAADKRKAISIAHKAINQCNELWVFGEVTRDRRMQDEIEVARQARKKIVYFDNRGNAL